MSCLQPGRTEERESLKVLATWGLCQHNLTVPFPAHTFAFEKDRKKKRAKSLHGLNFPPQHQL